jgi:hypothetical protein
MLLSSLNGKGQINCQRGVERNGDSDAFCISSENGLELRHLLSALARAVDTHKPVYARAALPASGDLSWRLITLFGD